MVQNQAEYVVDFEPELMFRCCECGTDFCDEEAANECCRPEVVEVWRCCTCSKIYGSKVEAVDCCEDKRNAAVVRPTTAELEAAGQLRLIKWAAQAGGKKNE